MLYLFSTWSLTDFYYGCAYSNKTMAKLQFKRFEKEKEHDLQDTAFQLKEL